MPFIARPSSGALPFFLLHCSLRRSIIKDAPSVPVSRKDGIREKTRVFGQSHEAKAQPLATSLFIVPWRGRKRHKAGHCAAVFVSRGSGSSSPECVQPKTPITAKLPQAHGLDADCTHSLSSGGDITFSGFTRRDGVACSDPLASPSKNTALFPSPIP